MDETKIYDREEFDKALIDRLLVEISSALKEKGYDPIKQLAGYIMSGDPGYISSYKDSRKKIVSIERSKIIEFLLERVVGE